MGKKEINLLLSFHACVPLLQQPARTVSAVLQGAGGPLGFQDPESSGKQSRQVAVLLKEILKTLKLSKTYSRSLKTQP